MANQLDPCITKVAGKSIITTPSPFYTKQTKIQLISYQKPKERETRLPTDMWTHSARILIQKKNEDVCPASITITYHKEYISGQGYK